MTGLSKKQAEIFTFPESGYDALICDGAIRSGKTTMMSIAFFDDAMRRFDGQRFGVCGRTVESAIKNIIEPFIASGVAAACGCALTWRRAEKVMILSKGGVVNKFEVFGGKDERSYTLIQGRTLAGVLLDEVALMPESFVKQALSRCSVTGSKFWFNCNPEGATHWFKKEWIDNAEKHNAMHLHFTMEDNPGLSEEIKARYKRDYSGVFYDRYILGLWVLAEGLVYPWFDKTINVTDKRGGPGHYYISIDYGTQNPTAMGLWRVYNGTATMEAEYYHSGRDSYQQKTDEEYYQDLERFAEGHKIERVIVDPSAASFKASIFRHGKFSVWNANNDVIDGIRLTGSLLKNGNLKFHESCTHTFEEFGLYSWDPDKTEDAVIKENDHCMDMVRYLCMTVLRREIR